MPPISKQVLHVRSRMTARPDDSSAYESSTIEMARRPCRSVPSSAVFGPIRGILAEPIGNDTVWVRIGI